ncbi:MAG: class I SAM-dependent methyltransferase [Deltaproteobacteria bacterium]|nr:class I SAM-dependent methyltransferase [Deltaproteobacteria bacterium]
MFHRIPHKDQSIEGIRDTTKYLNSHRRFNRWQFKSFLKRLSALNIDGRYLEIGSGPGLLAAEIASVRPEVDITAVELSPEMVSLAQDQIAERKLEGRVRFLAGSADDETLLGGLGKFSLVYSTFSLHHWEKPVDAFRSLYNAVADGGVLLIHDLCRVWWLYMLPLNGGFIRSVRAAYRPKELKQMLQQAGVSPFTIETSFPRFEISVLSRKRPSSKH